MTTRGKVYLVGSGPGDPGLVTLRGCQALAEADVVLYDYLVNPLVLNHVSPHAERICLGRHGRGRIMPQREICQRMVRHAQEGRCVVRLKAGDPVVFAHAAEEIAALQHAQIHYEIIPGITAALAVGSYCGIPLTQGDAASAVALVTGQERGGKEVASLDYRALASFPGMLVFYMGVTTVETWTAQLIEAGKSPETPAAIVRRVSWPDQQSIICTLGTLAAETKTRHLRPPALFIVGPVAASSQSHNWFVDRPLFGTRILVTRAADQASALTLALSEQGADVLMQPAIEILPPADWTEVNERIAELSHYDWLVFSSANGVRMFLNLLLESRDVRCLGSLRLAAIGPGTARELAAFFLTADLVPHEHRAEALADALAVEARAGRRFLLVRASRGREVLAESLSAAGGQVDQVVAYRSTDVEQADPEIAARLSAGEIDWITVTSSAIARSLARLFGPDLSKARLASISPVTSQTLRELGLAPAAEAVRYTIAGLVEAIVAASSRGQ